MTISRFKFEVIEDEASKPLLCCRCGHAVEPAIEEFFNDMRAQAEADGIQVLLTPCCTACIAVLFGLAHNNRVLN